jgi:hypothetical protein
MDAEAVQMFSAPVEGQLENFMELGDAGFAADQEAPPYQGADIPKDYSKLIKFCHLRSLPDHARNLHNLSPRNLPLSISDLTDKAHNITFRETLANVKVRVYGDTAVANYTETYDALTSGM